MVLGTAAFELSPGSPSFVNQVQQELVQVLVQDCSFQTAVRDGALHTAAVAAVRLLKPHLDPPQFKRPPDRRTTFSDDLDGPTPRHPHAAHQGPVPGPSGPSLAAALQRQLSDPRLREVMRCMRGEALVLEDLIPWTAVRRTWRNKRSHWRRQVKAGEVVPELALRLKELRAALLTDDSAGFVGCGQAWRVQLEACIAGRGSHHSLVSVWEELKAAIRAWLDIRDRPDAAALPPAATLQLHSASAARAVAAMQAAACSEAAMLQVPLESILGHNREGLAAVQHAIEQERRAVEAQLAARVNDGGGAASGAGGPDSGGQPQPQQQPQPLVSYFSSINAGWEEAEFDSGGDSDCGSDTDLDSEFD